MADFISNLISGYSAWRRGQTPSERGRLVQLAQLGQAPKALVVSCIDSRVAPEIMFGADPGELLVLRNVANLVPPYEPSGEHHGTSAAIEFALLGLQIPDIVVLGHSRCGGIGAYLQGSYDPEARGQFIGPWMDIIRGTREEVLAEQPGLEGDALLRAVEEWAIRRSLANLRTFPEVQRREADGRLMLHGARVDIATGQLHLLDHADGRFKPAESPQVETE